MIGAGCWTRPPVRFGRGLRSDGAVTFVPTEVPGFAG